MNIETLRDLLSFIKLNNYPCEINLSREGFTPYETRHYSGKDITDRILEIKEDYFILLHGNSQTLLVIPFNTIASIRFKSNFLNRSNDLKHKEE